MFGYLLFAVVAFSSLSYFIIWPVVEYFRDPKGLRKYPNLNFLSGITDLGFIYESHKGFRSHALLEAHQKSPVVRIGPNSLSYSDLAAIKVSQQNASEVTCLQNVGHLRTQHKMYQGRILRYFGWDASPPG